MKRKTFTAALLAATLATPWALTAQAQTAYPTKTVRLMVGAGAGGGTDIIARMLAEKFADGLKGALLICHGGVDTNVHVQDSIRLAQRLVGLRKTGWELALYPVENHAFEQETSWADEYKRTLKLLETHLRLAPPSRAKAR